MAGRRLLAAGIFAACALSQTQPAEDPLAGLTPADIAGGKKIFDAQCVLCHGTAGTGGRGPALTRASLRRAADNAELVDFIAGGDGSTGMPGFWFLGERQILLLAAYVRSLGRNPSASVAGDTAHGRAIYDARGCSGCHIVNGQGSAMGPELSSTGLAHNAEFLRQALLEPAAATPEGFAMVTVRPLSGAPITGIRVNEDSFTIQLKDTSGNYHSFRKANIAEVRKDFATSPMPSYRGRLSEGELTDLVAYLASLKGDSR